MRTRSIVGRACAVVGLLASAVVVPGPAVAIASATGCVPEIIQLAGIGTGGESVASFNGTGTAVGNAAVSPDDPRQPVVWANGRPTLIPLPPGLVTGGALDINARGDVVGNMFDADGGWHGYYWDGRRVTLLRGLGGGFIYARRINARGEIAGTADDPAGLTHAVRWPSAAADPQVLAPVPPDNASFAKGINDSGVVGGDSDLVTDEVFQLHAALWNRTGSVRLLDGIGGPGSEGEVYEVNNIGQAAGDSLNTIDYADPALAIHATRWEPDGSAVDVGVLPGDTFSIGLGLSPSGYVAGASNRTDYTTGESGISHAFVWSGSGPPLALPIPHGSWAETETIAHQIDDRGSVAGGYQLPGEPPHAILWTCAFAQAFQPGTTTTMASERTGSTTGHHADAAVVHRLIAERPIEGRG
jgi:uncharacterized membrane protein